MQVSYSCCKNFKQHRNVESNKKSFTPPYDSLAVLPNMVSTSYMLIFKFKLIKIN